MPASSGHREARSSARLSGRAARLVPVAAFAVTAVAVATVSVALVRAGPPVSVVPGQAGTPTAGSPVPSATGTVTGTAVSPTGTVTGTGSTTPEATGTVAVTPGSGTATQGSGTGTPDATTTAAPDGTPQTTSTGSTTPEATGTPTEDGTGTPAGGETGEPTPEGSETPEGTRRPGRTVYLPLVVRGERLLPLPRVWGVQLSTEDIASAYPFGMEVGLPHAQAAGMRSVRTNLRWDWVEPENTVPRRFRWVDYDARLAAYGDAGFDIMVSIIAFPSWAARYGCGERLLPGMDAEWRSFVREAVARYSRPPYRVAAWEIGNEVDGESSVRADDVDRPPGWGPGEPTVPTGGCWGDNPLGYRDLLRAAYEEIKTVSPGVPVAIGGLGHADLTEVIDQPLFTMDFLDRLLDAGGGDYFDVLSYHWFPDVPKQPTGPEKHARLAGAMRRHGLVRPVWLSETYRLSVPGQPDEDTAQIRFLTRELVEMLAFEDVERVYWYGWVDFPPEFRPRPDSPNRGLVRADGTTRPALAVLPDLIEHTAGRPTDVSTGEIRAWRFAWAGAGAEHVVAWSQAGGTLRLPVAPGSTVEAVTYREAELLAGTCCTRRRLEAEAAMVDIEVGRDTTFITIR